MPACESSFSLRIASSRSFFAASALQSVPCSASSGRLAQAASLLVTTHSLSNGMCLTWMPSPLNV
eukprot:405858-Alexandrium_andersonii.AAC.1